jgi:hypothetical protein
MAWGLNLPMAIEYRLSIFYIHCDENGIELRQALKAAMTNPIDSLRTE